jgi:hypothetical protein
MAKIPLSLDGRGRDEGEVIGRWIVPLTFFLSHGGERTRVKMKGKETIL